MSTVGLQLVNVRMENPVYEADARAFVWILIGEFNVNLPEAAGERCYGAGQWKYRPAI